MEPDDEQAPRPGHGRLPHLGHQLGDLERARAGPDQPVGDAEPDARAPARSTPGATLTALPAPAANRAGGRREVRHRVRVQGRRRATPSTRTASSSCTPLTQGADVWTQNLNWTAPTDGTYRVFAHVDPGHLPDRRARPTQPSYATNYFDERGVAGAEGRSGRSTTWPTPRWWRRSGTGDVQLFMDSLEITDRQRLHLVGRGHGRRSSRRARATTSRPTCSSSAVSPPTSDNPYHSVGDTGTYRLDGDEQRRQGIVNDYQDVLTQLYRERMLQPLKKWLNSVGIKTRAQISYGRPLEISEPGMDVDYPEAENFNQYNQVDIFRLWTGGREAREQGALHARPAPQLALTTARAQLRPARTPTPPSPPASSASIWHVWAPGYGYGNFRLARVRRARDRLPLTRRPATPASHDYDEFNAHLGRVQQLLQTGKSRTDVGFIHQKWVHGVRVRRRHRQRQHADELAARAPGRLLPLDRAAGQRLHLRLLQPAVPVRRRRLASTSRPRRSRRPATRPSCSTRTGWTSTARKRILDWAKKGLKVVILENAASRTPFNDGKDAELKAVIDELKTLPTVRTATVFDTRRPTTSAPPPGGYDDNVMEKLQELGVEPYAGYAEPNLQLLTQTRAGRRRQPLRLRLQLRRRLLPRQEPASRSVRNATHPGTNIKTDIVMDGQFIPYVDRRLDRRGDRAGRLPLGERQDRRPDRPRLQQHRAARVREGRRRRRLHIVSTNADSARATDGGVAVRATESGDADDDAEQRRRSSPRPSPCPRPYDITDWDLTVAVVAPERDRRATWSAPRPSTA